MSNAAECAYRDERGRLCGKSELNREHFPEGDDWHSFVASRGTSATPAPEQIDPLAQTYSEWTDATLVLVAANQWLEEVTLSDANREDARRRLMAVVAELRPASRGAPATPSEPRTAYRELRAEEREERAQVLRMYADKVKGLDDNSAMIRGGLHAIADWLLTPDTQRGRADD